MKFFFGERNFKKVIIFFILFHFTLLFIEDRTRYVPQIIAKWEEQSGGAAFVNFIKSVWRTILSLSFIITIFWAWFFFKCGFIIFFLEAAGIFKMEKFIFFANLKALIPIYILIFLKFIYIVFLNKNFNSSLLLLFNTHSELYRYFLSSIELFRILEFSLLYTELRNKTNVNALYLIFLLIPLFLGENLFNFTLEKL